MSSPGSRWLTELSRAAIIIAVAALLGLGVNAVSAKPIAIFDPNGPGALPDKAPRIATSELKALQAQQAAVLLIDVRNPETVAQGAALNAVNAPAHDFLAHYESLGLGTQAKAAEHVVVLCDSAECPAGDRVAQLLKDLGHRNVRVLQGGWVEYRAAGLPLQPTPQGSAR